MSIHCKAQAKFCIGVSSGNAEERNFFKWLKPLHFKVKLVLI